MKYVGLHSQIRKNNIKSIFFLILFPTVLFILVWLFLFVSTRRIPHKDCIYQYQLFKVHSMDLIAVLVWFLIA